MRLKWIWFQLPITLSLAMVLVKRLANLTMNQKFWHFVGNIMIANTIDIADFYFTIYVIP